MSRASCAQCSEAASIRHRRLPAEQVVWLMVGLVIYRHKSISEVLDDLGLAVPDSQAPFISKSAAAQAHQRLGSEPLKWLFDHYARHWPEQDSQAYIFKGLQLFAMDGTTLRTHDTTENRDHFGVQLYASGAIASYPQVRGVTRAKCAELPEFWQVRARTVLGCRNKILWKASSLHETSTRKAA